MALKVLVIGSGICGPAFATLLQRSNPDHHITVIERAPILRASGLQLDFKAQGTPIIKKLGLLEEMRKYSVEETGAEFVGPKGETLIRYGILDNDAGGEAPSLGLTREIEIMRGDIVRVLYDTSLSDRQKLTEKGTSSGSLTYKFNTTVTSLVNTPSGATVTFSSGQTAHYDLVVGADGQNSSTRKLAFGTDANAASIRPLDAHVAYFRIPSSHTKSTLAKFYLAPRSRAIMLRNSNQSLSQIYLFTTGNTSPSSAASTPEAQKAAWADTFAGAGWETPLILSGMRESSDFYTHPLVQVKLPSLVAGSVALVGDAGYCPSVLTGRGTTSSLIGAWVLAGELARTPGDVAGALGRYDEVMREPIRRAQHLGMQMRLPASALVIWAVRWAMWVVGLVGVERLMRVMKVVRWVVPEKEEERLEDWALPEYPELGLEEWP